MKYTVIQYQSVNVGFEVEADAPESAAGIVADGGGTLIKDWDPQATPTAHIVLDDEDNVVHDCTDSTV